MAYFMRCFFVRRREIGVFGARDTFRELFPFFTYEKEFAHHKNSSVSKPRFSRDYHALLSQRTDQAAVAHLLRPSVRVCLSPDHGGNAAFSGRLVFGEHDDATAAETGAATGRFHARLRVVPPD